MVVYRGERCIAEVTHSIWVGSHPNWELRLVNDLPPDSIGDVIRTFDDPRVGLIEHDVE